MTVDAVTIEAHWARVFTFVEANDGTGILRYMEDFNRCDRGQMLMWNGIFWRLDDWFVGYFARTPRTDEEEKLNLTNNDLGRMRFMGFIERLYPDRRPVHWRAEDLPRIFNELKGPKTSNEMF